MNKKFPIATMSKAAVLTLMAGIMSASTAYAAQGDYYDTSSKKIFKSTDLSDKKNVIELFKSNKAKNQIVYQLRDNLYLDYGKTNDSIMNEKVPVTKAIKMEANMVKPEMFKNFEEYKGVSNDAKEDVKENINKIDSSYKINITSNKTKINASTNDNAVLTFELLNKDGKLDTNANDVILSLTTTYGTLSNTKVTIQNGKASVILTGEYNVKEVEAKVNAQIIDAKANSQYKDLIGKVVGEAKIAIEPQKDEEAKENLILTSAKANQADRVVLYFNKEVTVDDFVEKDKDGKYEVIKDGEDEGNAILKKGVNLLISNNKDYSNPMKIRGLKPVNANKHAIEVVLDKRTSLKDNSNVFVKSIMNFEGTKNENVSEKQFILTDARRPETVSVKVNGLKEIQVSYSESIVKPDLNDKLQKIIVDGGKNKVSEKETKVGDFDQVKGEDTRHVLTVKTEEYMKPGKHVIQLAGIRDFAGLTDSTNICTTQTLEFTVEANNLVPEGTVTVESPEQYRIKFNCDVAFNNERDLSKDNSWIKLMKLNKDTNKYTDDSKQDLKVKKVSDSEYVVEVTKDWTQVYDTAKTNKNYYNDKYALVIAKGDKVDEKKVITNGLMNIENGKAIQKDMVLSLNDNGSIMNSNDTTSPKIVNIKRDGNTNDFNIIMDKPVKVKDISKYDTPSQIQKDLPNTIVEFEGKDKDGNVRTFKGTIIGYGYITPVNLKDDKTIKVTLDKIQQLVDVDEYSEDWKIIVRSISDDVGNTAETLTKDFKVTKTAPIKVDFRVKDADKNKNNGVDGINVKSEDSQDKIYITFTKAVRCVGNYENAIDYNNYILNGDPLPKGSNIQLDQKNGKIFDDTIVITLPKDTLKASESNTIVLSKEIKAKDGDLLTWENEFVLPNIKTDSEQKPSEEKPTTKPDADKPSEEKPTTKPDADKPSEEVSWVNAPAYLGGYVSGKVKGNADEVKVIISKDASKNGKEEILSDKLDKDKCFVIDLDGKAKKGFNLIVKVYKDGKEIESMNYDKVYVGL